MRKNEQKKIALWNRPCAEGSARVKEMKKKRTNEGEGVCYYAKSEYQGQCQREPAGQLGDCHSSPAAQLDAVISGHRGHGDREADHHGDVGNWGWR